MHDGGAVLVRGCGGDTSSDDVAAATSFYHLKFLLQHYCSNYPPTCTCQFLYKTIYLYRIFFPTSVFSLLRKYFGFFPTTLQVQSMYSYSTKVLVLRTCIIVRVLVPSIGLNQLMTWPTPTRVEKKRFWQTVPTPRQISNSSLNLSRAACFVRGGVGIGVNS